MSFCLTIMASTKSSILVGSLLFYEELTFISYRLNLKKSRVSIKVSACNNDIKTLKFKKRVVK